MIFSLKGRSVLWVVLGVCLFHSLGSTAVLGLDQMRAPRKKAYEHTAMESRHRRGGVMREMMHFFKTTISRVDGNRCPMYPTCSQYGEEALAKHGAITGLMMVIDRLFHEWSETGIAPPIWVHGIKRFWDPVEENDFWFIGNDAKPNAQISGENVH